LNRNAEAFDVDELDRADVAALAWGFFEGSIHGTRGHAPVEPNIESYHLVIRIFCMATEFDRWFVASMKPSP
jgi:hypothetical protein